MSDQCLFTPGRYRPRLTCVAVAACLVLSSLNSPSSAQGADVAKQAADTHVAVCTTPSATILRRPAGEKAWQIVNEKGTVNSGDLLVGMPGAKLNSQSGAVQLTQLANLDGQSRNPILESAVILHSNPKADLDFTLDRGRVSVENLKKSGAALVRLHVYNETWDLTLSEPGSATCHRVVRALGARRAVQERTGCQARPFRAYGDGGSQGRSEPETPASSASSQPHLRAPR